MVKINYIELIYGLDNKHQNIIIEQDKISEMKLNDITYSKKILDNGILFLSNKCNDFSLSIKRDLIDNEKEKQLETYLDLTKIIVHYSNKTTEIFDLVVERYSTEIKDEWYDFNMCQQIKYESNKDYENLGNMVIRVKEVYRYNDNND